MKAMPGPLFMRRATCEDLDTLTRWRVESAARIAERERRLGLPSTGQWATPYDVWKLQRWIERRVTWMALADANPSASPVATVTLDSEPEPAILLADGGYAPLWSEAELSVPAWYMSKLNSPMLRGAGELLTRWCQGQAAREGAHVLRIDVWTGFWPRVADRQNLPLRQWYESLGFRYVRTVPDVVSGCLMEIDAVEVPGVDREVAMLCDTTEQ